MSVPVTGEWVKAVVPVTNEVTPATSDDGTGNVSVQVPHGILRHVILSVNNQAGAATTVELGWEPESGVQVAFFAALNVTATVVKDILRPAAVLPNNVATATPDIVYPPVHVGQRIYIDVAAANNDPEAVVCWFLIEPYR